MTGLPHGGLILGGDGSIELRGQPKPDLQQSMQSERREDAVREAAREFETWSDQDAGEWLKGRTNREFSESEIADFNADVHRQVVADLVDILDHQQRGPNRRRRVVKVKAPRGYVRKAIHGLTDSDVAELKHRLEARGWSTADLTAIDKHRPAFPPEPTPTTTQPAGATS